MSNTGTQKIPNKKNASTKSERPDADKRSAIGRKEREIADLHLQLNEQARFVDSILSSISDFVYTFDRDGRFVFVNQPLLDLWGLKLEEAVGKDFSDLNYPEELAARLQFQIQQVFQTKQRVTDETMYISPKGIKGYYEYIFNPYFGPDNEVLLVAGTTRDITERKLAEEEIKRLSDRNYDILESITDGFFAVDENWKFTYVNPQAGVILDQETGKLIGKSLWDMFPEAPDSEFEMAFRRVANEKIDLTFTSYYPDHKRWYEVKAYPAPQGITVYIRNATERILTEKILRVSQDEAERQKRLYDTILSNTLDLIYVFDLKHRFTYANKVLLEMWGKTWEESIGKTCLELGYEPWHAELNDREIDQVIATKKPTRGEVPFSGAFGDRIYDYIFVPIIGADGEVEAVGGTMRDITERQKMEEALREDDRRKDEFIATLAHELRNPLAPIRSGLEIMRREDSDEKKKEETLGIIERQTDQIVRLVDDLLDISRITQDKIKLQRERIELKDVIDLALETSSLLISESDNEFTMSLPDEPVFIDGDPTRLAQIFLNILNNAAKYSDPGGRISLTVKTEGDDAVISIKDTGFGIESEMLTRIFEMFGQVEMRNSEPKGGLGIGLSVVKKLLEMHGGRIDAYSEGFGKGSEFIVRLPLAEDQMSRAKPQTEASLAAGRPADKTPRRIMVVDDNRDAVEMLETLLTLEGHTVKTAFDGGSALKIAEDFDPEICLCDIGMPEMDGYELAGKLSRIIPDSMLISLSGWGQEKDIKRSFAAGFSNHLVKPVQFDELLALIDFHDHEDE
ncbi:MAG: PAS domain-containing protein [Pyrinomonadaceae bacterium]